MLYLLYKYPHRYSSVKLPLEWCYFMKTSWHRNVSAYWSPMDSPYKGSMIYTVLWCFLTYWIEGELRRWFEVTTILYFPSLGPRSPIPVLPGDNSYPCGGQSGRTARVPECPLHLPRAREHTGGRYSEQADMMWTHDVSMVTSLNRNIFCITGHLCGEFTVLWCFLWSAPEQTVE